MANKFLIIALALALALPVEADDNVRLMVEIGQPNQLASLRLARPPRRLSNRWRVVEVPALSVPAAIEELKRHPAVASVHAEQVYQAALVPNDAEFSEQYGLHTEVVPADINAPEAWAVTTGSPATVIAIVDGGVDLTHEDLRDKAWRNAGEIADNGVDDDHNGFIDDINGWDFVAGSPAKVSIHHATHVAGIAAAASNNGLGIAGVDWGARIMSVRVLGSGGFGGEANIIEGINYAVAAGADIINLSIAGPASQALVEAIANAYHAGVVIVAAAGNSGLNTDRLPVYPACADTSGVNMVLGVGALNTEGEPARFSNYGGCVDIIAPGEDIFSTKVGDRYGRMTGTSMSAPFVSGVAGLYLALHPDASPAQVIAAIRNSDLATGKLNAAKVVGAAGIELSPPDASPLPPPPQPQSSGNSGGDSGSGGDGRDPEPEPVKKGQVKGVKIYSISAADRKAPDFIKNKDVPAIVARLFKEVIGRPIKPAESVLWKSRARSDKATQTKLRDALAWHKLRGKIK